MEKHLDQKIWVGKCVSTVKRSKACELFSSLIWWDLNDIHVNAGSNQLLRSGFKRFHLEKSLKITHTLMKLQKIPTNSNKSNWNFHMFTKVIWVSHPSKQINSQLSTPIWPISQMFSLTSSVNFHQTNLWNFIKPPFGKQNFSRDIRDEPMKLIYSPSNPPMVKMLWIQDESEWKWVGGRRLNN
jgi:hypothetical protein